MRTALLALVVLASVSCGTGPELDPVALVSPCQGKYEIELHARINVYGGPCNPTCFPTRVDDRHYVYVDRLEGRIDAQDLVLRYERENYRSPQSALKGSITISEGLLTVDLQRPYYKGKTVDHYGPYPYNGRYQLRSMESR